MLKLGAPKRTQRRDSERQETRRSKQRTTGVRGDLEGFLLEAFGERNEPNKVGRLALIAHWKGRSVNSTFHGQALRHFRQAKMVGFSGHFRQWYEVVMWADWYKPRTPTKARA